MFSEFGEVLILFQISPEKNKERGSVLCAFVNYVLFEVPSTVGRARIEIHVAFDFWICFFIRALVRSYFNSEIDRRGISGFSFSCYSKQRRET